jgi:hypothetical protein
MQRGNHRFENSQILQRKSGPDPHPFYSSPGADYFFFDKVTPTAFTLSMTETRKPFGIDTRQ